MKPMAVGAAQPRWALELATTAVATVALLFLALRLWRHDLSVPFNYWGDTLHFTALAHGLMLNGWPHHIPQLGAPFGFEAVAFPSLMSTDWAMTWLIAQFVDSPGAAINLFWLISILLTALSAMVALRLLGVSRYLAIAAAILYALLPGTFIRNTAHISLVYYTVPLLAAFCITLLSREEGSHRARALFRWAVAAAFLQGLNYIYHSFFAVGLLLLCGTWAGLVMRDRVAVRRVLIVMSVLLISGAVNLAPAMISWQQNGKPPAMDYKSPAESEVYALKLRRLLLPHEESKVPVLGHWARADRAAQFPHENENEASRLGTFGAAGLLTVLVLLSVLALGRASGSDRDARASAVLLLITLLITTVGGLGTIFNVLVAPDIRAYNRFSVFLAFFAFAALAILLTHVLNRLHDMRWRAAAAFGVAALIALSAYDQTLDARRLTNRYAADQAAALHERQVVRTLEAQLPMGASVFQFPITSFPPDGGRLQMGAYDHARPFLWSSHLRWSWPTFSHRHHAWDQQLLALPHAEWARRLVLSGFDAVWIDRNGADDRGAALESALLGAGAVRVAPQVSARYGLVDLAPVKSSLQQELGNAGFAQAAAAAMPVAAVDYGQGFYAPEMGQGGRQFRWMQREANLSVRNFAGTPVRAELALALQSGGPGEVAVLAEGREIGRLRSSLAGEENALTLTLEPRATISLRMVSQHPALNAPNDPRALYTTLLSLQLRPSTPALQAPAK
jgi:phosphoglycerol transferase